ncbi:MAG: helix-hairpin-helix domain-containing protein [Blautia sp.]|nr:helix-hairpin-helix domain-containing protein [Blautia sp.]
MKKSNKVVSLRREWYVLPLLFVVVLFLTGCGREREDFIREIQSGETAGDEAPDTQTADKTQEAESPAGPSSIYVDVSGAVMEPGVYELPEGSRVFQAIDAAGGLTEDAAPEAVNRAESVVDGQQIRIPGREELMLPDGGQPAFGELSSADTGKVNLNSATLEELCTLPGIGESKAETILTYRKKNGRFSGIEELMNVPGIKEATFEKIKEYVTV